jgi:uncharacterized 2Fe-2S/4Fe-4S cluster protein (DUF4445 family)
LAQEGLKSEWKMVSYFDRERIAFIRVRNFSVSCVNKVKGIRALDMIQTTHIKWRKIKHSTCSNIITYIVAVKTRTNYMYWFDTELNWSSCSFYKLNIYSFNILFECVNKKKKKDIKYSPLSLLCNFVKYTIEFQCILLVM